MGAILQPNSRHSKSAQDRGQVSTHTWDLGLLISHLLGYLWDLGTWDKVRLSQGNLQNTWTVFFFFLKKTFIKGQPYSQLCSLLHGSVLKEGTVLHYRCPASMIFFLSVSLWGGFTLSIISCTPSLPPIRAFPDNKHQIQGTWMVFALHKASKGSQWEQSWIREQRLHLGMANTFYPGVSSHWMVVIPGESVLRRNLRPNPGSVVHHDTADQWCLLDEDGCGRCAWLPSVS